MEKKIDQLDKRNAAMRTLAIDLAYLRKTNDDLIVIFFMSFSVTKLYIRMRTKK